MTKNSPLPVTPHKRIRVAVAPLVRSYIKEAARFDDSGRPDRTASWRQIQDRVRQRLRREGLDYSAPGERAIQKIAKEARGDKGVTLDDPWFLAYRSPLLPPESTGDLLRVWRLCLMEDRVFTVREAIWVARLRSLFPPTETGLLRQWAVIYARYDRSYEGEGPKRTPDLDAELAFQRWKGGVHEREYTQAVMTGTVPLSEGRVTPRYVDDVQPGESYLPSYVVPTPFFLGHARLFLRQVGGIEPDKRSWWPQAESVTVFWLRRITARVSRWQGIDKGTGGNLPGENEYKGWSHMGRRLASLVITWLETWDTYEARQKERDKDYAEWASKVHSLRGQIEDMDEKISRANRESIADLKEERRATLERYSQEMTQRSLNHLPLPELKWKPTELLIELGLEKQHSDGNLTEVP